MESLVKPNWLVEVFNKHLDSDDWPSYDNAVANDLTSGKDSANEEELDQHHRFLQRHHSYINRLLLRNPSNLLMK